MDSIRPLLQKNLVCALFLVAFFPYKAAFADDALVARLKNILDTALTHSSTPGAVLLVSNPQLGTITISAGLADEKSHQPMKDSNNFRIASMSKTFLATTILKLVEEKKLSLDAKIAPLLPNTIDVKRIPNGQRVTIRQLLQMRSGIPNYVEYDTYTDLIVNMVGKTWTPELCIQLVYDKKPSFSPGKSYEYSNTNYLLLQLITEKLTGYPYAASIRQQILAPLQLKNTFIEITESNTKNYLRTHGYQLEDEKLTDVTYLNDGLGMGDSGMVSTVADLDRFIQALLKNKTLLTLATLKTMLRTKDDYGLGIYREEINGYWAWTHNGMSSGFQGQYYYFPKEQLSIVLLTNNFDTDIIEKIIPKVLELLLKNKERITFFLKKSSNKNSLNVTSWF
ncbi:serine hydrolase domain-containing protein [Legionella cardiaca]|uniref:Serine hydrolase n=1 Tax=Legionella cardiaca TaxID=1071983 RepID=A0ABY8ASB4_9GAMM|nr:serine hydrolase domain-containing protein [Legionella cardiaca]WED43560.1 serine hydrolase [Legionella cardiaca]